MGKVLEKKVLSRSIVLKEKVDEGYEDLVIAVAQEENNKVFLFVLVSCIEENVVNI